MREGLQFAGSLVFSFMRIIYFLYIEINNRFEGGRIMLEMLRNIVLAIFAHHLTVVDIENGDGRVGAIAQACKIDKELTKWWYFKDDDTWMMITIVSWRNIIKAAMFKTMIERIINTEWKAAWFIPTNGSLEAY